MNQLQLRRERAKSMEVKVLQASENDKEVSFEIVINSVSSLYYEEKGHFSHDGCVQFYLT